MRQAVFRNTSPYLILYDQHAKLLQLLAKVLDLKAYQTVGKINISPVVEDVERTVDVYFKSGGDPFRLHILWESIQDAAF